MTMSVTVVIPVWDDYTGVLCDAVDSVLAQEGCKCRILVVDNASRTALPELPPDVRVLRLPKRSSVGEARNAGLRLVDTPFVLFLDSDDVLAPGALRVLLCRMLGGGDLSATSGYVVGWNAHTGAALPFCFPSRTTVWIARWPRLYQVYSMIGNRMPATAVMMRTDLVRAAGGFGDHDFCEDWSLNCSLALRGRITFVERPTRLYRIHSHSLAFRRRNRRDVASAFSRVRARLNADPAMPLLARLIMPLITIWHVRVVTRLTPGGWTRRAWALDVLGDGGLDGASTRLPAQAAAPGSGAGWLRRPADDTGARPRRCSFLRQRS
jgi:glycosyltransferase involved in cell wall biosynthesis